MEILQYCKMQFGLLLILIYISFLYIREGNRLDRRTHKENCNTFFDWLFILGEAALFLDGFTAYTVNHLDTISPTVNGIAHLLYLLTYQSFIFVHFMYWLSITDSMPRKLWTKICCYGPLVLSVIITVAFMPKLYYFEGVYTNYSKGISAYSCFGTIGLYSILTLIFFITKRHYIPRNKITAFIMSFSAVTIITLTQIVFNETLVAGIAVVLDVLSLYLCMENPSVKYLEYYQEEMVTGFATLVENKDDSTGGHIARSSSYAIIIAKQLRKHTPYHSRINKDYIEHLTKAAPMHDIGKIGIPDSILQKPGRLTPEEFEIMKTHAAKGGEIIQKTFGYLDDEAYEHMAFNIATYHHEKWNGKGYPSQLKGEEIPLCARIMAVADVFDAISADRCYRPAMPLPQCYEIIKNGRGTDFDPDIVDALFEAQQKIETIYYNIEK